MTSDGLVRPVNAPDAGLLSYGVQPGSPPNVIAHLVIIGGTGAALYAYNGAPGAGNLILSITSSSGTDPFGNTVPSAGLNIYPGNSTILGNANLSMDVDPSSGQVIINMVPGSTVAPAHVALNNRIIAGMLTPGVSTEQQQVILQTGTETGATVAELRLTSESFDTTIAALAEIIAANLNLESPGTSGGINLIPAGSTFLAQQPGFNVTVNNAGLANEYMTVEMTSGTEAGAGKGMQVLLNCESNDHTLLATAGFAFNGVIAFQLQQVNLTGSVQTVVFSSSSPAVNLNSIGGTVTHPTLITTDTWHAMSLAAGWSTLAGWSAPSYMLLPDGRVAVSGLATHAAFSTNTALTSSPLPAAYRPINNQVVPFAQPGSAGFQIDTSGNVTATTNISTGTVVFNGTYPVNL